MGKKLAEVVEGRLIGFLGPEHSGEALPLHGLAFSECEDGEEPERSFWEQGSDVFPGDAHFNLPKQSEVQNGRSVCG